MQVVQDRKQPLARTVAVAPLPEPRQRPLQRVLDQIVGLTVIAREGSRIAAQPRDFGCYSISARWQSHSLPLTSAEHKAHDSLTTQIASLFQRAREDTPITRFQNKVHVGIFTALGRLVSFASAVKPRARSGGHKPRAPGEQGYGLRRTIA